MNETLANRALSARGHNDPLQRKATKTEQREERWNLEEKDKKQIPLRLSATLWKELVKWAEDDFRSLNSQIEYLLHEAVVKQRKQKPSK